MNLADKTIINILAKSGEAVFLLVSSVVMVRYLSKEEYGTFLQIMLIMNTSVMLTYLGLPQSIYYYMHHVANKVSFVYRNAAMAVCIGLLAAGLVYSLHSVVPVWLNNPLLSDYYYVVVLLIFLRGPATIREPLLISNGNLLLNSIVSIVGSFIFYVPAMAVAILTDSFIFLCYALVIASLIDFLFFLILIFWFVRHDSIKVVDPEKPGKIVGLKEQLKYALPIGFSSYISILSRQIDSYIVSAFFTPQGFAVYSRGAMRIPMISSIQLTINDIMMSYYVKDYADGKIENVLKRFHLCIEKVAKIKYPVFFLLFLVSQPLILFVYTEQYVGAVPVFRVYLLLLLIEITTFGIVPRITGKTKSIFLASIINLLVNILVSCLLVPVVGPIGAALGTVACAIATGIFYLSVSSKLLGISMGLILPWKVLGKIIFACALSCFPAYCMTFLIDPKSYFILTVVQSAIFTLSGIVFFMRFDLIAKEDFDTLSKWFNMDVEKIFNKIALIR